MRTMLTMVLTGWLVVTATGHRDARAQDSPRVKVMTFNLRTAHAADGANRWANRREMATDLLRDEAADFVGLQEALGSQIEDLRQQLPHYRHVGRSREASDAFGELTPILYDHRRWSVIRSGTFWLSDQPQRPGSITWGNTAPRIVTWARLREKSTGWTLVLYNTHFSVNSAEARQRSAEQLARHIATRAQLEPVIVTGDFNAEPNDPPMRTLRGEVRKAPFLLTDAFTTANKNTPDAGTLHAFTGRTDGPRIDYILVGPNVIMQQCRIVRRHVDGRYPSDHFPVTATVRFKLSGRAP